MKGLLLACLLFCIASPAHAGINNCRTATTTTPGCVEPDGTTITISNGVISATTTGGGGSVAISDTTSNVSYRPLFATGTSASASTLYIDNSSPWSYNSSTGLTGILGITTSSLTDNGNAALSGTTTISTARIMGGTINGTTIGATTSSTALFTTASAATFVASSLTATTTAILSSLTTGALTVNGTGLVTSGTLANSFLTNSSVTVSTGSGLTGGGSVALGSTTTISAATGSLYIQPSSLYTTTTDGTVYPNVYTGSGGNASASEAGWALANTITASAADQVLQARFPMPAAIPPGTLNLCSKCLAAAGSGVVKYTISDADVADGSSPSAATLTGETQTSLSFTTTDGYLNTCTALTHSTATANDTNVVAITFNRTNTTIGVPMTCKWMEAFK